MFRPLKLRTVLPLVAGLFLTAAAGCSTDADDIGSEEQHETWDQANAPETFGVRSMKISELQQEEALKGYLTSKPWADSYWPLNKKGMSHRWNNDSSSFDDFEAQAQSARDALAAEPAEGAEAWASTFTLSPAEKYDILMRDDGYTMTKEGWDVYKEYEDYEFNWSWMGHCHGWAPAAYLEEAPAASVIADIDGQQVMFTEGDIRGLMTKAYASNQMSQGTLFMGSRCNARTITKDELGRVVDGTLYERKPEAEPTDPPEGEEPAEPEVEADTATAKTIFIKRNYWSRHYLLTYSETKDGEEEKVMRATKQADAPEGSFVVNTYASVADYQANNVESEQIFNYNKTCRDTNAGSFHLVLAQYLSDLNSDEEKRSFVMDVTREDQVWNQPVYGFESTIESVENIDEIEDPLKEFRAEGTKHIAKVTTEVHYALERGPYVDYNDDNGSKLTSKTYRYTLELDEDGFVIGGEWAVSASEWGSSSSAPDFLWAPQGELTNSAKVDYSTLKRLHSCSMDAENATEVTTPEGDTVLAVACQL
jgi:hypothetical protein